MVAMSEAIYDNHDELYSALSLRAAHPGGIKLPYVVPKATDPVIWLGTLRWGKAQPSGT